MISSRIVKRSDLKRESSDWSAIDSRDLAAGTPAEINVASCRVNRGIRFFDGRVVWKNPFLPLFSEITFSVISMG